MLEKIRGLKRAAFEGAFLSYRHILIVTNFSQIITNNYG